MKTLGKQDFINFVQISNHAKDHVVQNEPGKKDNLNFVLCTDFQTLIPYVMQRPNVILFKTL
jgi:hypothetical protein